MIPTWNSAYRQQVTNSVFAMYSIPLEVVPLVNSRNKWKCRVFGGSIDTVLERLHNKQNTIFKRLEKYGLRRISRQDALFMYVSQWLEWSVLRGESHPTYPKAENSMYHWLVLYYALGQEYLM